MKELLKTVKEKLSVKYLKKDTLKKYSKTSKKSAESFFVLDLVEVFISVEWFCETEP